MLRVYRQNTHVYCLSLKELRKRMKVQSKSIVSLPSAITTLKIICLEL